MAIQPASALSGESANAEAGPSTPPASGNGYSRTPHFQLRQSLHGHKRGVTGLKWSSDGRVLVSAGADGMVNIWSSTSPSSSCLSHHRTIRAHRTGINDLSLSPDDLYFATAADDCTAQIFALPAQLQPSLTPGLGAVGASASIGAHHRANAIAGSSRPLKTLAAHTAPILAVSFSPKSNLLVTGSMDESAIVWDARAGVRLRTLPAHSEPVWTVGWDGEGVMVLTGSADGLIRLWDASTGQCLKTLDNESNSPVTAARFTPNPFYLVAGTPGAVRVYNIHTGRVVKTLRAGKEGFGEGSGRGSVCVAFMPATAHWHSGSAAQGQGHGVARSGSGDVDGQGGDVDMDGESAGAQIVRRPLEEAGGKREAWVIAASAESGKIVLWELGSRRVLQVLEKHTAGVVALDVSPLGVIATGGLEPENAIHIWSDGA